MRLLGLQARALIGCLAALSFLEVSQVAAVPVEAVAIALNSTIESPANSTASNATVVPAGPPTVDSNMLPNKTDILISNSTIPLLANSTIGAGLNNTVDIPANQTGVVASEAVPKNETAHLNETIIEHQNSSIALNNTVPLNVTANIAEVNVNNTSIPSANITLNSTETTMGNETKIDVPVVDINSTTTVSLNVTASVAEVNVNNTSIPSANITLNSTETIMGNDTKIDHVNMTENCNSTSVGLPTYTIPDGSEIYFKPTPIADTPAANASAINHGHVLFRRADDANATLVSNATTSSSVAPVDSATAVSSAQTASVTSNSSVQVSSVTSILSVAPVDNATEVSSTQTASLTLISSASLVASATEVSLTQVATVTSISSASLVASATEVSTPQVLSVTSIASASPVASGTEVSSTEVVTATSISSPSLVASATQVSSIQVATAISISSPSPSLVASETQVSSIQVATATSISSVANTIGASTTQVVSVTSIASASPAASATAVSPTQVASVSPIVQETSLPPTTTTYVNTKGAPESTGTPTKDTILSAMEEILSKVKDMFNHPTTETIASGIIDEHIDKIPSETKNSDPETLISTVTTVIAIEPSVVGGSAEGVDVVDIELSSPDDETSISGNDLPNSGELNIQDKCQQLEFANDSACMLLNNIIGSNIDASNSNVEEGSSVQAASMQERGVWNLQFQDDFSKPWNENGWTAINNCSEAQAQAMCYSNRSANVVVRKNPVGDHVLALTPIRNNFNGSEALNASRFWFTTGAVHRSLQVGAVAKKWRISVKARLATVDAVQTQLSLMLTSSSGKVFFVRLDNSTSSSVALNQTKDHDAWTTFGAEMDTTRNRLWIGHNSKNKRAVKEEWRFSPQVHIDTIRIVLGAIVPEINSTYSAWDGASEIYDCPTCQQQVSLGVDELSPATPIGGQLRRARRRAVIRAAENRWYIEVDRVRFEQYY